MIEHDPESRRLAADMARRLQPLVEAQMKAAQAALLPRVKIYKVDQELLQAALAVAQASERLETVRYTSAETSARMALEKRARELRAQVRKRPAGLFCGLPKREAKP